MDRKTKKLRAIAGDKLLMAMADYFEESGAATLREVLASDPATYHEMLLRVMDPKAIARLGDDPTDEQLAAIARRVADGIRHDTPAEGKPTIGRLN